MFTIMVVEDDPKLRGELKILLTKYGYDCTVVTAFGEVAEAVERQHPHLVLLDINLPMYDGYHVCREIRKSSDVPIIIVTSRDTEWDELMSINLGADDFIAKPYHPQILLARIASVLKRAYQNEAAAVVECRGVRLDPARGTVESGGGRVELTKNEQRILGLLMRHQGRILTREEIMNELWQSDEFVDDNTLTVNINRLRRRLEGIGVTDLLVTRRGQGYIIE